MKHHTGRSFADSIGATPTPVVVELCDGSAARVVSWAAGWAAAQNRPLAVLAAHPVRRRHIVVRRRLRELARLRFEMVLGPLRSRHPELVIREYLTWDDIEHAFLAVSDKASALVLQRAQQSAQSPGRLTRVGARARCPVIVLPEQTGAVPHSGPVVLGLDDSPESWEAAEFAVEVARRWDVELTVVHAWEVPATVRPRRDVTAGGFEEAAHRRIGPLVSRLRKQHPDLRLVTDVVRGDAVPVLLERSRGAALLVVGSRGRGGVSGMLLGSVSTELMAGASVPVAVARESRIDDAATDTVAEESPLLADSDADLVSGR
jgi:nucleotide-binding universal stress UspA family protein